MVILINDTVSYFYLLLYLTTAFVISSLTLILLYVACSKKYRLNWYEKNLLERNDIKRRILNSEESSIRSFYPSSDDLVVLNNTMPPNAPIIGVSNVPISITEEILPVVPTTNYRLYPIPSTDQLISPQTEHEKNLLIFNSPNKNRQVTMQTKLDPAKINASLYQEISESKLTTQSRETSESMIHLLLSYDIAAEILTVRIIEASNLYATEINGTVNPYAKIKLLPHNTNIWQTRVHKRTLNPVFDEDFVFEVNPHELNRHTLEIILCDFIAYSRHRNIGILQLSLNDIDFNQNKAIWKSLKPCTERETKADLGDIMISLAYLPSAERLTVTIIKARNLKIVDESRNSSDPFIKVSLIQDRKRIKKQKTSFHRNTTSPTFNEALSFDISREALKRCTIEFRVMHDSLLGSSELLGFCLVGNDTICHLYERQLFSQLLHDQVVPPQWLPLTDTYAH